MQQRRVYKVYGGMLVTTGHKLDVVSAVVKQADCSRGIYLAVQFR